MGMLGPFPNRKSHLSVRNGVLLYKQLIRPLMDCVPREEVRCPLPCPGCYRCYNPSVFASLLVPLGT